MVKAHLTADLLTTVLQERKHTSKEGLGQAADLDQVGEHEHSPVTWEPAPYGPLKDIMREVLVPALQLPRPRSV